MSPPKQRQTTHTDGRKVGPWGWVTLGRPKDPLRTQTGSTSTHRRPQGALRVGVQDAPTGHTSHGTFTVRTDPRRVEVSSTLRRWWWEEYLLLRLRNTSLHWEIRLSPRTTFLNSRRQEVPGGPVIRFFLTSVTGSGRGVTGRVRN